MAQRDEARQWALEEFGGADLGDARRSRRLTGLVCRMVSSPAGRVTRVVHTSAERQGAYDFLSNEAVEAAQLDEARAQACADRCCAGLTNRKRRVLVILDQSSLGVTDHRKTKDFGVVGSYRNGGRGLSTLTALATDEWGAPYGILGQRYWARPTVKPPRSRTHWRRTEDKETHHVLALIESVAKRFAEEPRIHLCFVGDRGYDAGPVLAMAAETGQEFVIRACWDRRLETASDGRLYLRQQLKRAPVLGTVELEVAAGYKRVARTAKLRVSAASVTLRLNDPYHKKQRALQVQAIWVHEVGKTPDGESRLDWILLTNRRATTIAQANATIALYRQRWRIEDFHRSWKSGSCNVEDSRLHTASALTKWAILLASVASRIERIKHLSRENPDAPATVEFSDAEIRAIIWLKRQRKKRTETISDATPSLSLAVRWLAEIGGYTGYGGPPGVATIGRGYDRISLLAEYMQGEQTNS
jgi:hypothetical protein